MIFVAAAVLAAYFIGAIPTAYIFGKILKGIDVREYGSGNVGATNVFRTVGKGPGIAVLVLDFLKGIFAVTVIPAVLQKVGFDVRTDGSFVILMLGAAAIAGHIWTVFLKFKGGKGVATTAGVMAGLSPVLFLSCFGVWVIIFAIWRYVSLASIAAAAALPVFAVLTGQGIGIILFCAVLCMVGVYSHKSNIKRLLQGQEKKIIK